MQGQPPASDEDRLKGGDGSMGQMLTAKQVAEVKGCSFQYVQRIIKEGKLQAVETLNEKNRKTYLIPLEALDEELQQKWYQMKLAQPPEDIKPVEEAKEKKEKVP